MKLSWTMSCLLVLSACTSEPSAPAADELSTETAPVPQAEAPAAEAAEAPAGEPSVAEPQAETPASAAAPIVAPDPNAPKDVAAPPKGAKKTKSGLVTLVLKKGNGKGHPAKFDTVKVNYTGWTPDGRMFDSSASHGQAMQVPVNHLIHGFAEGIRLMVPGERRRLWIPGKLGYGEKGDPEQAPRQPLGTLVFDVELVSFDKAPPVPEAPKDVGRIPPDATRSDSGLAWRVLNEGVGTDKPIETSVVEISYTLWTADGEAVESSVLRGGTDTVGISRLVPGWTEGMEQMVEGERRIFWIPEDLAYQGDPHRPEGMLVVDVTLVQIRRDLHQVR
jgi:peptidylprolyl isomerase